MKGLKGRFQLAVSTRDGRLFYELVRELRLRGVGFLPAVPGEALPLTVRAVLTSEEELPQLEESIRPGVKIVACRLGSVGEAVSKALLAVYGVEAETFHVGIDPGKTLGFAVVAGGVTLQAGSFRSLEGLLEAFRKVLAEWKPKSVVVKVGGRIETLNLARLKDFLEEASKTFKTNFTLKFVDEAGTTVKAKRRGAKHRKADEASAVEIALSET
ncbi:MAG: hypothetical protein DRO52_02955 [Candidatus Hecatellales archaeon]|nr:MAG: hypothetical protein DRO52_02955 [Candidatus Hecatellales archaeon]